MEITKKIGESWRGTRVESLLQDGDGYVGKDTHNQSSYPEDKGAQGKKSIQTFS